MYGLLYFVGFHPKGENDGKEEALGGTIVYAAPVDAWIAKIVKCLTEN